MLRLYYNAIFLAMVTFAVGAWGDLVGIRQRSSLLSVQRFMLLRLTKDYRTTSTVALQVVSGTLPLDLEVVKRRAFYLYKKQGLRNILGLDLRTCCKAVALRLILQEVQARWEQRWLTSTQALITRVLPLCHYLTQCLTGHGDFRAKLHALGLGDSPLCRCGRLDTVQHAILDCHYFMDLRMDLQRAAHLAGHRRPPDLHLLVSEDVYPHLASFATDMLIRKKSPDWG